ncbi:GSCFA domain-containing protein [Celeribacter marinus]|uniref:GSCFA domain-containing protein n=1 Tax=Celeribacter marinus TaxID=1397108 RepID=UPI00317DBAE0
MSNAQRVRQPKSAVRSPYDTLEDRAFWRTAVAACDPTAVAGLYRPKFAITKDTAIMTAGSCFAQHVHRTLKERAWTVIDTETPRGLFPRDVLNRFGYAMYSARYGNIYTVRQLRQLLREAYGDLTPANPVWTRGDRFFDAQRPNVEPDGLESAALVREARARHLTAICAALAKADVFVFTLGLTETWMHRDTGTVYPTAPGTIAGSYDPDIYAFHNATTSEILTDLAAVRAILQTVNPQMKMLLTVSPVPLTATATPAHVLSASTYSKAVLRAAAGEFCAVHEDVDYFPSFDVITNPAARSSFYKDNLRSVEDAGVAAAMRMFFAAHDPQGADAPPAPHLETEDNGDDDVVCEEALIRATRT